jgi:hypothetical protein
VISDASPVFEEFFSFSWGQNHPARNTASFPEDKLWHFEALMHAMKYLFLSRPGSMGDESSPYSTWDLEELMELYVFAVRHVCEFLQNLLVNAIQIAIRGYLLQDLEVADITSFVRGYMLNAFSIMDSANLDQTCVHLYLAALIHVSNG